MGDVRDASGQGAGGRELFAETAETVAAETGTTGFYAVKIGPGEYGMFQTYADEAALQAHQAGAAGKDAVVGAVGEIFAAPPRMTRAAVFRTKAPNTEA